jgi:phytoene synthase
MTDAVVAVSRDMIRKGSRSFAAAAMLFDPATRASAYLLYAWCRHCDDEIDGQDLGHAPGAGQPVPDPSPAARAERLEALRSATLSALAGEPQTSDVFTAFQRVVQQHRIPAQYPLELLAGFEMDVNDQHYETLADTLLYCYRVAGVVGVMMACVMGTRERAVLLRASDLGIGFQLTNIARDVIDDARNDRCYLPAAWLREAGIPRAALADPAQRPAVAGLVSRLLDEADRYYASAAQGLRALPFRSAWAIATALGVYRDIGRVVRTRGPAAWDQRAVVGTPRKLWLAAGGGVRALLSSSLERRASSTPRANDLWATPDLAAED